MTLSFQVSKNAGAVMAGIDTFDSTINPPLNKQFFLKPLLIMNG